MALLRAPIAFGTLALLLFTTACSSTRYPSPVDRLETAEAAEHTATGLGADQDPTARFHLALARQQIAHARELMAAGHNERAAWVLTRAATDAQLALALARENVTRAEAQEAAQQVQALPRGSR